MRSSFFTFNITRTGLNTARANINVVAHNVANSAIPGFSRQATVQKANPAFTLRDGRGMYGTGSQVTNIVQIRDRFIDRRFWSQSSVHGRFAAKTPQLSLVQATFGGRTEALALTGVAPAFGDFFSRLQELSENAPAESFRLNTIMAGETLSELIRHNAEALRQQQQDINKEIRAVVTEINSLGTQLAAINRQIFRVEQHSNNPANDLRDERALLIDRLSELANINVEERDFSAQSGVSNDVRTIITLNGHQFVNHTDVRQFELVPREAEFPRNEFDVPGLYDIRFVGGGNFNMHSPALSGTLRGLIDMRDGNGGHPTGQLNPNPIPRPEGFDPDDPSTFPEFAPVNYKGIPFYIARLNQMVRTFAQAINEGVDAQNHPIPNAIGHRNGYDSNGDSGLNLFFTFTGVHDPDTGEWIEGTGAASDIPVRIDPETGQPMLDANGRPIFDYRRINAFNFTINRELMRDPGLLAAEPNPVDGESSNDVLKGFLEVQHYPHLFREGRLTDFIIATTSHAAIGLQQAERFQESYAEIVLQTENQRLSVSGVDINEEMLNMIRFQQMFQANSRMFNTINLIYETMINRLGA